MHFLVSEIYIGKGMFISFDIWAQQTTLRPRKRTSSECYSINWWRWNCTITRNIFLSNNKVKEWNDAIFHILLQYLSGTETNVTLVSQCLVQSTRTNVMKGEVLHFERRKVCFMLKTPKAIFSNKLLQIKAEYIY